MRFKLSITIIAFILCISVKEKTSQYKGVCWDKRSDKWKTQLCLKGQKLKYGGCFKIELDAAKRVNQLCEELGIPLQNPGITAIPTQQYQVKEKASQYKGVQKDKRSGKWHAYLYLPTNKGQQKFAGSFNDEMDAAKRLNQLCEELGIPLQNPGISSIPNQQYQAKEKTSQYKGVYWHRQSGKWYARLSSKVNTGQIQKYGGCFKIEQDAAKRINQLCEELGIPLQNPGISSIPNQQYQAKEKKSQYKGVHWHKQIGKWYAHLHLPINTGRQKFGGTFINELDAAKRVNQLCEELGIPLRNPGISAIPNQEYWYHTKQKTSQYKGVHWHEKSKIWYAKVCTQGSQIHGGVFKNELDAAKKVNQICQEHGIPPKNPGIETYIVPNEEARMNWFDDLDQRDKDNATQLLSQGIQHYNGLHQDLLMDMETKFGIIPAQTQQLYEFLYSTKNYNVAKNNTKQTIAEGVNPVNGSEIPKNDDHDDGGNEKKRKRKKKFINDKNFLVEDYYFYDHLLK